MSRLTAEQLKQQEAEVSKEKKEVVFDQTNQRMKAVEVLDTTVSCVEDEKSTTVTTTLTLRHPGTKKEYQQTTTETRAKQVAAAEPVVAAPTPSAAPVAEDPKKKAEFDRVLQVLFVFKTYFILHLTHDSGAVSD